MTKCCERAELWISIGAGLCLTASARRIYVLSVLIYVAQLVRVPPVALQQEERVLLRLVPGPGDWMTAQAFQSLKDLGFNFEFASLVSCATAAAARTYQYENRHVGRLRVQERAHRLLDRLHRSDNVTLQTAAWIRSCSLLRLREAAGAVTTAARARGITPSPCDADPTDDADRKTW